MEKASNIIQLEDFTEDSYGYYQSVLFALEEILETQVSESRLVPLLQQAIDYAIFPAGKRIRPMLACLLCADLKGDVARLLPAATALELVHCASLIHDDLPALDDDDMRRGKPSCHKRYSEATAILAGDALFPMAITLLLKSSFSTDDKVALSWILSDCFMELCCGQQLDMLPIAERGELEVIHQLKTGALFKAACQFGAIGAGVNPDSFAALGTQIGILFQFIDDMLDVFGENEEKGRDASSDLKNQKETLATTGNREIFERRLRSLKASIENTLRDIADRQGKHSNFPKIRFLLEELFCRAETI